MGGYSRINDDDVSGDDGVSQTGGNAAGEGCGTADGGDATTSGEPAVDGAATVGGHAGWRLAKNHADSDPYRSGSGVRVPSRVLLHRPD